MDKEIIKNEGEKKTPYIIGLTGGIGSGKTAAAQILERKGAYIIDTDVVAKTVTAEGTECDSRLKAAFPECVVSGVLQRSLLKSMVFKDEKSLKLLNSITHPYIIAETLRRAEGQDIVVIQVPLLFESGFDRLCNVTVCVVAPDEIRESRTAQRDNIPTGLIRSIMSAQLPQSELKKRCDFVIENSGSLKQLEGNVEECFRQIKEKIALVREAGSDTKRG